MYKSVKVLNPKEHGFYRYTPSKDFYFAKNMNLIPITFSEIKYLCCEYPIVIIIEDEKPKFMLLTGLEKNEVVDEKGKWKGNYIPSFLKRYPFTLVQTKSTETLHIGFDLESGLFSSPEGNPLFNQDGTPSETLENIQTFLNIFQKQSQITENILLTLQKKGLLQPTQFTIKKAGEEEQKIGGFFMIDKTKLFEQEDEFLLETVRNGWIELIELHILSLSKIEHLQL